MPQTMPAPALDDLLVAHFEYAGWAVDRTLAMLDKLPAERISAPAVSSFPSILATLQHLYRWNEYYFTRMGGGTVGLDEVAVPETLTALIGARLDALDPQDRALIMDAAVLGQSFTPAALAWLVISARLTSERSG